MGSGASIDNHSEEVRNATKISDKLIDSSINCVTEANSAANTIQELASQIPDADTVNGTSLDAAWDLGKRLATILKLNTC